MDEYIRSRTEITIETHSVTTIKTRNGSSRLSYCDICLCRVRPLEIPLLNGDLVRDVSSVERLLSDGSIHTLSNGDMCSNSLAVFVGRDNRQIEKRTEEENQK